jgi:HK97 gp10 family phage protein
MTDESARIEYKLTGGETTIELLNSFAGDMKRKVVLQALRAAARPIIKAARARRPPKDFNSHRRVAGTLRKNIKSFTSKKFKGANGVIGVYVTVKASKKTIKNSPITGDPFYYRFVEGGHKIVPRRTRKTSLLRHTITSRRRAATDRVKAYPFLGPAFESQGKAAIDAFNAVIVKRVDEANSAK